MNRSRPAPLIRDETGARQRFLDFALSPSSKWTGNFRDLNGAVVRMATLAEGGRISIEIAQEEIDRLKRVLGNARSRTIR